MRAANRVMQGMFMLLEAKRWIEKELPWWRRRQGRDHIWYLPSPACTAYMSPLADPLSQHDATWEAYSLLHSERGQLVRSKSNSGVPRQTVFNFEGMREAW